MLEDFSNEKPNIGIKCAAIYPQEFREYREEVKEGGK
jgi:hypothetical protein